jgi:hypothetical protein
MQSGCQLRLADITFTLPEADGAKALPVLQRAAIEFEQLLYDNQIGKVSLIGTNPLVDTHATTDSDHLQTCTSNKSGLRNLSAPPV